MNLSQQQYYIKISVVAGLILVLTATIIYPAIQDILSMNQEITAERIKLESKLSQGLNIQNIKTDYERTEPLLDQLNQVLIPHGSELKFIADMEELALIHGVTIDIVTDFSGETVMNFADQVPMQINVSGSYKNIVNYMKGTERIPYYLNNDMIMVNTRGDELSVQLVGQAYFQKE